MREDEKKKKKKDRKKKKQLGMNTDNPRDERWQETVRGRGSKSKY